MLDHCENTDGLGAIFPPMISTVIALRCLGYERDRPVVQWALRQLDDLLIEERPRCGVQPCVSPVWDTAITTIALADAEPARLSPRLLRAVRWLLEKEVRHRGRLAIRRPGLEPTGWHFQFHNEFYPDLDDTAMVLLALQRTALATSPRSRPRPRGASTGCWRCRTATAAGRPIDVDIDNEVLTKVPFADHNAMLDPSCADITARVLELLGTLGYRADHPAVARALDYLWRTQEPQGCWYGRWGVNYIYGTWQVLAGARRDRVPDGPSRRPARPPTGSNRSQQADGGWGETCQSYDDPALMGQGEPTASQTAWAVLGPDRRRPGRASTAVRRGIEYPASTPSRRRTWDEDASPAPASRASSTCKYHLYRVNFPLMAIARYQAAIGRRSPSRPGALASRHPGPAR